MTAAWTTSALKNAITRRGEYMQLSPKVAEALLYHEHSYGRTEVHLAKPAAQAKLDVLLDQLKVSDIPNPVAAEYKGIARLRRAVEQRSRERAVENQQTQQSQKEPAPAKERPAIDALYDNDHKVDDALAAQEAAFLKSNPAPGNYAKMPYPSVHKRKDRSM